MPLLKKDINVVNVFSIDNKGGNPCAVVDNADYLSTEKMQSLARHLNLPETIFILRNKHKILLRFFATKKEHPLCYHGTLGAAFYLYKLSEVKDIEMISYADRIAMRASYKANTVSLSIPNKIKLLDNCINSGVISQLLKIKKQFIDKNLPLAMASIGNPKLFVPIIDRISLFNLNPDLDRISKFCKENHINGIYTYSSDTEHSASDYVGRNFNPLFSDKEDIATGTAAVALCQLISLRANLMDYTFIIEQGANVNSPSKIIVSVNKDFLEIKGQAYFSNNNNSLRKIYAKIIT